MLQDDTGKPVIEFPPEDGTEGKENNSDIDRLLRTTSEQPIIQRVVGVDHAAVLLQIQADHQLFLTWLCSIGRQAM